MANFSLIKIEIFQEKKCTEEQACEIEFFIRHQLKDKLRHIKNFEFRDFPGGPVGKAPCSQCWGPGFDPWLGN